MKMPCGIHKNTEICNLPSDYLEWVAKTWDENTLENKKICKAADEELQFRTKYDSHF
jgi:hypothetical protein